MKTRRKPCILTLAVASCIMLSPVKSFAPSTIHLVSHARCRSEKKTIAFVPSYRQSNIQLFSSKVDEVDSMKVGEIRKELESYGISTKSFLERKEMVEALKQARAEGKRPVEKKATPSSSKTSSSSSSSQNRDEKLAEEMKKINKMKVGDIKKELQGMGVSTKSFFEKSEFVRALAEARVDGVKKGGNSNVQEEEFDPSYRDVIMQKFTARDPRELRSIIDIKLR